MDKNISKIIAQHNNILTPKWDLSNNNNVDSEKFNYPLVVKPNNQGSTVGLRIVHNNKELKPALDYALKYDSSVLIEEYIEGRELTVTVLDGKAYPVCEIIPSHEFYDYECKYTPGMSEYICPSKLNSEQTKKIQKMIYVGRMPNYLRVICLYLYIVLQKNLINF